ncbi:Serine/Arginine-related protein 53-like [Homarus americanus]|uniref:Serine/Arginine-related protein 53-like n=1 Tax=Homarus americanus TaxID=6706 RepID=A0A8J5KIZ7_HOMAM|nr:Serine/Arginine-related protein 53-like [Homarus americanus]
MKAGKKTEANLCKVFGRGRNEDWLNSEPTWHGDATSGLSRSSSSTSSKSRHRRHKKSRRHRRYSSSRSRSRSRSPSNSHRSRSISRDRDRHRRRRSPTRSRSRSRSSRKHKKSKHKHRRRSSSSDSDRSEKYSKSRSARSSVDRDRSSRGSTKDRDRRDRDRDRDKEKEKERDKVLSPVPEEPKSAKKEMSESEKIAYSKAIEEIGEDGFVQQTFKSSRGEKAAPKNQADTKNGDEFNFGTQAELSARAGKFIPLSDDSLFSPHLFGDPEEREEKYLRRIFSLRQKALLGEPI